MPRTPFDAAAVASKHFEAFERDCPPERASKLEWKEALEELISLAETSLGAVKEELEHEGDEG